MSYGSTLCRRFGNTVRLRPTIGTLDLTPRKPPVKLIPIRPDPVFPERNAQFWPEHEHYPSPQRAFTGLTERRISHIDEKLEPRDLPELHCPPVPARFRANKTL